LKGVTKLIFLTGNSSLMSR